MRRNFLKTLFLLLGASSALSAVAYDVHVGDGYYNLDKSNGTASLTYLYYYSTNNNQAYSGDLVLPETFEHEGTVYTVTSVASRAFFRCDQLTSIVLPSTVTKIESNAFFNCTALKSITLPPNLQQIENAAFLGCAALETVELPSSLVLLGGAAFSGCSSMKNVVFPASLSKIDSNAFYGCSSLTHIDLPRGLQEIGLLAFSACTGLESVVFPDGLTNIKVSAFQDCTGLKRIELGSSIRILDTQCFGGCKYLEDVYCSSPKSPVETYSNAFSYTPRLRLHVPNEGVEAYHKVDTWAAFKSILPLQCATPTFSLDDESITFATATNLNYAQVNEEYTYSIEVSDVSSGTIAADDMEALGNLVLTYDVRVKATAEGCEDSDELVAQLCWLDSDLRFDAEPSEIITSIDALAAQKPVLITSSCGDITLSGLADGERVTLYDLSGHLLATTSAIGGTAQFGAVSGPVVVIRVSNSSFKVRVN